MSKDCNCFMGIIRAKICVCTTVLQGGWPLFFREWGIVQGNDPYLYGEKVKAYLRHGARPLPGLTVYPNPQVGYGALCVRESIPG